MEACIGVVSSRNVNPAKPRDQAHTVKNIQSLVSNLRLNIDLSIWVKICLTCL